MANDPARRGIEELTPANQSGPDQEALMAASQLWTSRYLDAMDRVAEVIAQHPDRDRIRLMFTPSALKLAGDEVLVEHAVPGGLTLRAERLSGVPRGALRPGPDAQTADEIRTAILLASRLWARVLAAGGPEPTAPVPVHVRGEFDQGFLDALRPPIGARRPETTQTVALAEHGFGMMERVSSDIALYEAERRRRRTQLSESIDVLSPGPLSLAALLLSEAARCRVSCDLYQSSAGQAKFGGHTDAWYGVVVQLAGSKDWRLRTDASGPWQQLTVDPGDVLLVPRGMEHEISTPDSSLHAVYAVMTHEPIEARVRPA